VGRLGWGVLGVANIALRAVIPAIRASANGRLVAIASRSEATAQEAAARMGALRAHGRYEALLEDPDVDAVYIPLPNALHREWAIRCAEAGRHVLCEKPLATTAGDCDAMIAACRRHGVLLMEAFMYRFHPRTERVARLVADGTVGDVLLVRASFTFRVRAADNIRLRPELGGGALYDVGCYGVNVSRMLLGEPGRVLAQARIGASGVDEVVGAVLQHDGGRIAVVDCGLTLSRREDYEVVGTDGRIEVPAAFLPGTGDALVRFGRDGETSTLTVPGANQYQRMVEHFAGAVLDGTPLALPPEDATANLRVIEAALRSARTGRAVTPGEEEGR
jgi:xylose dehydrogenase (NAD/NADP)